MIIVWGYLLFIWQRFHLNPRMCLVFLALDLQTSGRWQPLKEKGDYFETRGMGVLHPIYLSICQRDIIYDATLESQSLKCLSNTSTINLYLLVQSLVYIQFTYLFCFQLQLVKDTRVITHLIRSDHVLPELTEADKIDRNQRTAVMLRYEALPGGGGGLCFLLPERKMTFLPSSPKCFSSAPCSLLPKTPKSPQIPENK